MSQLTGLASHGATTLAISFLVSGKPGTYTLTIYIKPQGGDWEDRFRKIDGTATTSTFPWSISRVASGAPAAPPLNGNSRWTCSAVSRHARVVC